MGSLIMGLPVRVTLVAKALERLLDDLCGGGKPEDHASVHAQELAGRDAHDMGGHEGLAAAGRHAQAHVRKTRKRLDLEIRPAGVFGEGDVGAAEFHDPPQVLGQFIQATPLVILQHEWHQDTFTS
jgi:hypothetical protein